MAVTLSLGVVQNSQSIPNNTSNVTATLTVHWTYGSWNGTNRSGYVIIDGTQYNFAAPFNTGQTTTGSATLWSGTVNVSHAPDGTKTLATSAMYSTNTSSGIVYASNSLALTTIARKSSISSLTPTVEVNGTNQLTVNISRADTSFTHTVYCVFGPYSLAFTGVATSQSFAVPTSWINAIPNAVSGVGVCYVETFSGGVSLGYVEGAFTITVPSTVIPVVTDIAFARDTTGTDPFTTYAKGISKVSVSGVSVTNQYSATTALFKTYLHLASVSYLTGLLYNGSSFISAVIPSAGTMRLTTVVTDSRGRESSAYYEDFTVYDYFAPALTVNAFRCDSSGVADPSGEYLSASMTVDVAPVNNDNTKAYILEFKKTTDSTWTAIDTSALTGYSGTLNAVRSASSSYTWEVRATATDKVSSAIKTASVATKRVAINVGSSGTAVAIGKIAETADLLEVDLPAQFNKVTGGVGLLDFFYPVGTIYQTVSADLDTTTKMATHFGGTWVAWGTGRVPVGVDTTQTEFDTVEETNLASTKTHTLVTNEMPAHTHSLWDSAGGSTPVPAWLAKDYSNAGAAPANAYLANTTGAGGGLAHNNLQPYITCYFYKRTV